jgi:RNA polymerase sigma-70 factor (ECF subfamily)
MEDDYLLYKARQFDLQSLAAIYDLYSPRIYRYALRLLGDESMAEECVAETFSRLLNVLKDGKGPRDHLQAYLFRIAHNWMTDQYRRQPPPAMELAEDVLSDVTTWPEDLAERHFQQGQVRAALSRLTDEQRQVVVLKYLEGWDHDEIAAALKKPVGAVKALQHRGLAALSRLLKLKESLE